MSYVLRRITPSSIQTALSGAPDQGAIADNKRLGAALSMIREEQLRREPERRSDQRDPRLFKVG
jgi:hypothetical protein